MAVKMCGEGRWWESKCGSPFLTGKWQRRGKEQVVFWTPLRGRGIQCLPAKHGVVHAKKARHVGHRRHGLVLKD